MLFFITHLGKNTHLEPFINIHSNSQKEKQMPIDSWLDKQNALQ